MSKYNKSEAMYKDLLINYNSKQPNNFSGTQNIAFNFYYETLLHMCYAMFDFEGLPDNWDRDYLLYHLFTEGYVCVTETKFGVLPLRTSITGYNVYNKPTQCIIANPVLNNLKRTIGEDCVLVNMGSIGPDGNRYVNLRFLITFFASKLANLEGSFNTNLANSRISTVFIGQNQSEIETAKKAYDEYSKGSPAIFIKSQSTINKPDLFLNNVRNTYIADLLQDTKNDIYKEFLTYIGIASANTDKKERMLVDEVNANNQETQAHIFSWYYNLNKSIEEVNKMFGLNIKVFLNSNNYIKDMKEGTENELNQSNEAIRE